MRLLAIPMRRPGFALLLVVMLAACATHPVQHSTRKDVADSTFGPDGRYWRLLTDTNHLYVDMSDNQGRSYSAPVPVTRQPGRIRASREDRPAIEIDAAGRVFVLYSTYSGESSATFISYSIDEGSSFSQPRILQDPTPGHPYAQGRLLAGPDNQLYIFWLDDGGVDPASLAESGAGLFMQKIRPGDGAARDPQLIAKALCDCCRLAPALNGEGDPVVFARLVFAGSIRDHGLVKPGPAGEKWQVQRISFDQWHTRACPHHGPALYIAADGRHHVAWFTRARGREGLHYARSDRLGTEFSVPFSFGDDAALAGHADVIALGHRVVLAWQEFDGEFTRIIVRQSVDSGETWGERQVIARTGSEADYPFLVSNGKTIYLSWSSLDTGHRLVAIPPPVS